MNSYKYFDVILQPQRVAAENWSLSPYAQTYLTLPFSPVNANLSFSRKVFNSSNRYCFSCVCLKLTELKTLFNDSKHGCRRKLERTPTITNERLRSVENAQHLYTDTRLRKTRPSNHIDFMYNKWKVSNRELHWHRNDINKKK